MSEVLFGKLSAETREDYRELPATQSLLFTLEKAKTDIMAGASDTFRCGGIMLPDRQGRIGGQLDIIEMIIAMVNRG